MNWFQKNIDTVCEKNYFPKTVKLFLFCLYGWIIAHTLLLLPKGEMFWGPSSLIPGMTAGPDFVWSLFYLLEFEWINRFYLLFIFGQLLSAGICLYRIDWRWPRFFVLFFTLNLDNAAYLILDGGNNIIQLMLFYALLMSTKEEDSLLSNALSNVFVFVARLQVVFVYLVAGLAKATGETWQEGTALFYTLSVDDYSIPFLNHWIIKFYFLTVLGSYMTVLFQISFPWLVWFRQTRYWMLLAGTFLHLQISFIMGLLMFGFAMVVCYIIFNENRRSAKILEVLNGSGRLITTKA